MALLILASAQSMCCQPEVAMTLIMLEVKSTIMNGGAGLKFQILQEFLLLGYSVLLSDVDIVTIRNPFDYVVRDSDVEGMTDGWDDPKAYGYNDVFDDPQMHWSRFSHSMRVSVINR